MDNQGKANGQNKNGQPRETKGAIKKGPPQRKPKGQSRMDNPEKTKGISPFVFSGLFILDCPFGFLWVVHS
jgi:hypothetical protein